MEGELVMVPSSGLGALPLSDGLSLFDRESGQALALNRTAADVLALNDGTATLEQVVLTLAKAYDVAVEHIASDVYEVVSALEHSGVLRRASSSG